MKHKCDRMPTDEPKIKSYYNSDQKREVYYCHYCGDETKKDGTDIDNGGARVAWIGKRLFIGYNPLDFIDIPHKIINAEPDGDNLRINTIGGRYILTDYKDRTKMALR